MGIKTPHEYIESLKDGRIVYCNGERVNDVTKHPILKICRDWMAMDYVLQNDSRYQDLLLDKDEDDEKKEAQIEYLNNFKVTAYEPRALNVIEEDVRIRQVVKLSYFKRDDLVVKTIADDQIWEYDPEMYTWYLTTGFPKFK